MQVSCARVITEPFPLTDKSIVPNIVTDICMIILPIYRVYKLQIPPRHKAGLVFAFVVGSLTIVASFVRLSSVFSLKISLDATCEYFHATNSSMG